MNRTWLTFIIFAIIIMVVVGGYELYNSVTGGNVQFTKTVSQSPETLNEKVLGAFYQNKDRILIKTEDLANK
jgi:hypothetical protein